MESSSQTPIAASAKVEHPKEIAAIITPAVMEEICRIMSEVVDTALDSRTPFTEQECEHELLSSLSDAFWIREAGQTSGDGPTIVITFEDDDDDFVSD